MLRNLLFIIITGAIIATSCNANTGSVPIPQSAALATDTLLPNTAKVIHVFVALCDNKIRE